MITLLLIIVCLILVGGLIAICGGLLWPLIGIVLFVMLDVKMLKRLFRKRR